MKALWEYFEELDELVYVVDVQEFRIVYVNAYGRRLFSLRKPEDYQGKKCYGVLYGRDAPCDSCGNQLLEEGKYCQWTYWNPELQQGFLINSTLVLRNGRRYRLSVAVEARKKLLENGALTQDEALISECLLKTYTTDHADQALRVMLQSLGEKFACAVVSLYELWERGTELRKTYSWSRAGGQEGRLPQILCVEQGLELHYAPLQTGGAQILRDPKQAVDLYPELFRDSGPSCPVVLIPLLRRGELGGILRIDSPNQGGPEAIADMWEILANFVVGTLERRDLPRSTVSPNDRDPLTGAWNRYALYRNIFQQRLDQPVGMVYGDIVSLQKVNTLLGYRRGDELLLRTYRALVTVFSEEQVYRTGGDEFLVVCIGVGRSEFAVRLEILQRELMAQNCNVSLGSVWAGQGAKNLEKLLRCADRRMNQEKARLHREQPQGGPAAGRELAEEPADMQTEQDPFAAFLQTCHFDMETFVRSITQEDVPVYIFWGDMQQNFFYISENLRRDFNFPGNLMHDFPALLEKRTASGDDRSPASDLRQALEQQRTTCGGVYQIYDQNGVPVWLQFYGVLKWNAARTEPLFLSGVLIPLTQKAKVDPVTGLLDIPRVLEGILRRRREGEELVLLVVALREFQEITQMLGLESGIAIVQELNSSLQRELSGRFRMVRMDATHFMLVSEQPCPDVESPVQTVRQHVKNIYHRHRAYFDRPCSIGVLRCPRDGQTAGELLENAWAVLGRAELSPEREYLEFPPELLANCRKESHLGTVLGECISRNFEGFRIVIQPQTLVGSGAIIGGEALLRWRCQGEEVSPAVFIPILERTGLIVPVGKWVAAKAIQECGRLIEIDPDFRLSFNISYLQLRDDTLFPFIRDAMAEYGVPGKNLWIELTESHFDEMPEKLGKFVEQCQGVGITFALDDYGTAYSSLQLLLRYPADVIKLDRSLTQEIVSSREKLDFIMSVIYACHRFGKKVCVEGVETEEELKIVSQTGCDYIQGFCRYRPEELADLEVLLSERREEKIAEQMLSDR